MTGPFAEATGLALLHLGRQDEVDELVGEIDVLSADGDVHGVQRGEVAVLRMIAESWPERPVYFARTTTSLPRKLGLQPFLVVKAADDLRALVKVKTAFRAVAVGLVHHVLGLLVL